MKKLGLCLLLAACPVWAWAATPDTAGDDPAAGAEARLDELQRQYRRLQERTERELRALEARIDTLQADDREAARGDASGGLRDLPIEVSGDLRLRYEHTTDHAGDPDRNRGSLRGRLGAAYRLNERVTIGGRLVTGNSDDPNSADVTLSDFTDDFEVSLDRAYAEYRGERGFVVGGKFANPLANTDLVWDGDVNPAGLAGGYTLYRNGGFSAAATGVFAVIDEQTAGRDSDMLGGQLSLSLAPAPDWSLALHGGYYDYSIGSLANADAGDIRGNRLAPGGTEYLSAFELLDILGELRYSGWSAEWPISLTADYVKNLGAEVSGDTGYAVYLGTGRLAHSGDLRFQYGYSEAGTDAVFAAYSQDNITYSTNYRLHTLKLTYVPFAQGRTNLTVYRYRRDDPAAGQDRDDVTRIRLSQSFLF